LGFETLGSGRHPSDGSAAGGTVGPGSGPAGGLSESQPALGPAGPGEGRESNGPRIDSGDRWANHRLHTTGQVRVGTYLVQEWKISGILMFYEKRITFRHALRE
jgi:hypothetical protein